VELSTSSNDVRDKIKGVKHVIILFIKPVLAWLNRGVICSQLIPPLLVTGDHIPDSRRTPDCLVGLGTEWNSDVNSCPGSKGVGYGADFNFAG
jgi:hypothetical protein